MKVHQNHIGAHASADLSVIAHGPHHQLDMLPGIDSAQACKDMQRVLAEAQSLIIEMRWSPPCRPRTRYSSETRTKPAAISGEVCGWLNIFRVVWFLVGPYSFTNAAPVRFPKRKAVSKSKAAKAQAIDFV
jgi:hypothetical protein